MGDTYVSEQSCGRTHAAIQQQLERDEKRLNSHSDEIHTVNEAVVKLTMLLDAQDKRITALEQEKQQPKSSPFWNSSAGQWIIKGLVIIAVIIVLSALGKTVDPEIITRIFG